MEDKLTERQLFLYYQIQNFITKNGYSPTIRELCDLAGLSSPATMFVHLKKMREKGYITYVPGTARTIRIIKDIN